MSGIEIQNLLRPLNMIFQELLDDKQATMNHNSIFLDCRMASEKLAEMMTPGTSNSIDQRP
jgi:hypothetical protein